jgi:predicted NBD/HSP70 family sugar kinase
MVSRIIDPDQREQRPLSHNEINLMRALREIRRHGVATSQHVQQITGLGPKRTNELIRVLGDADLVAVAEQPRVGARDAVTLKGSAGCVVGVDMTLDQITVAVGDLEYRLLNQPASSKTSVPVDSWERTLDVIAATVVDQLQAAQHRPGLVGIGLGLPGPVQRGIGSPESDHLLTGWKGVPVASELSRRLESAGVPGARVVVGNDASVGALGVHTRAVWGNPSLAPEDLVYVRIVHGVGMGMIMKGRLVTGSAGYAGEIGHVRVEAHGPICTRCGRRGCLEVLASEKAVIDILRGHNWHEGQRGPNVVEDLVTAKDQRTWEEVGRAGWTVGFTFAAVCNVLNPAWIVLGGTLTELASFRDQFEEALRAYALKQAVEGLRTATWGALFADDFANDRPRDVGRDLTPEQLGAMAFVIDELADDFLKPRVLEIETRSAHEAPEALGTEST